MTRAVFDMVGMFDDLIPQSAAPAASAPAAGGMFDDLVPKKDSGAQGAATLNPGTWSVADNPLTWVQKNYERQYPQQSESLKRMADRSRGDAPSFDMPNVARRATEGFKAGYGDEPVINDLNKFPVGTPGRGELDLVDKGLRGMRGGMYGLAGAGAGLYEDFGGSSANADRLQRDLGIVGQFPGEPGILPLVVKPKARVEPVARPEPAAPVSLAPREPAPSRLLPADTPHDLPPMPAGPPTEEFAATGDVSARRSAGAAGTPDTGPLAETSPQTQDMLRKVMAEQGFTPHTLDQRLEDMSAHHFLGELTPSFEAEMSGIAGPPGPSKIEVTNSVNQRARESADRMKATFDRAFGENENRAQLQRAMTIERDQASKPFYDAFRATRVSPTPELSALLPALQESGALKWANKALTMERQPRTNGFVWDAAGPGEVGGTFSPHHPGMETDAVQHMPTTQAFQYAKEFLDKHIEQSLGAPGGANEARIYTNLKNALVNAIDNHPDIQVANIWKAARDTYATPTQVMQAMKTGERVLTGNIHADELPFLTAAYSPAELNALKTGMRGYLEDRLGRPGKQERAVINQILAPSNQAKIRWAIGDEAAERLFNAVEHEDVMHGAPTRLIYGSPTAFRLEAQKRWTPQPGAIENISLGNAVGAVTHPIRTAVDAATSLGLTKRGLRRDAEYAKMREEASRILTLQGEERNAVARALLGGERSAAPASNAPIQLPRAANIPAPKAAANQRVGIRPIPFDPPPPGVMDLGAESPGMTRYEITHGSSPVGEMYVQKATPDHAILTHIGASGSSPQNALGPQALRSILRQYIAENPEVKTITAERISGARDSADMRSDEAPQNRSLTFRVIDNRLVLQSPTHHAAGGRVNRPSTKLPHKAVGYILRSHKPGKHCSACAMYLSDGDCSLVRDPIVPQGWCRRFAPKKKD